MSLAEVQARMASITARFAVPAQAATGTAFAAELAKVQSNGSTQTVPAGSATGVSGAVPGTGGGTGTGTGAVTGSAAVVIADAQRYLGVPYVWGGTNPATGLDCSGLTQLVYGHAGIDLPRVSWEQAKAGTHVDGLANARPGDLLFFKSPVDHVAIYLGDHRMIHAPKPGKSVEISDVYETPSVIRRVLPDTAGTSTSATSATSAAYPTRSTLQALGGTFS